MKNFFLVFVLTISINSIPAAQQNIITNLSGDVPAKILAQVSFSGKVTDASTNEPLVGASIYFADLKTGAASNENGFFVINNINAGRYLVEVSHLGYTSIIETITITGDTKKDFAMSIAVIENDAVTVTGVSSATSTRRTPIPVSIMRKEQLFQSGAANLIDNISRIPGVAQVSTGPAISKPFIRGLGYNRVMVMNDGVKQEGQQWGDEHGIEIDEQNVNKIEVLKGPASLMYGSDALAGVINIVSFVPAYEGKVNGNLSSAYFGNNRQRNLHGAINSNKNGLVWGLYGSLKAAADYKNKYDGYVYNSKFKEKDFGGYIGINRKWGYSHLYVTRFDQELGLVEGDRDTVTGKFLKQINENGIEAETLATRNDFLGTEPAIPRQRVQHNKIVFDNNFHVGDNRLTVILGLQQNQRQEFGNVIETNEKNLWFDLKTFNYTVQYHLAEKKDWKTTIGANGMAQSNTNKGIEQLIPAYHIFDIGSFVHTQKKLGKVTLSGGFRLDNRHLNTQQLIDGNILKFSALQKNFTNWSGSAGFALAMGKQTTFKFNTARGFRAPAVPELSTNGAHEGTNRYEYGSQNLKVETSWQTDAGIELATEHLSLNAAVFYNAIHNFIYYRKLQTASGSDSIVADAGNNYFAFQFDQNNAKLFGAELNLDIHPHPLDWLHIENTFSWVRGKLNIPQDGSSNLPFIPAARLVNEVKIEMLKKGKSLRNLFFSIDLDNTFAQLNPFTGYDTETKTTGYSLLNMHLGAAIQNKDKKIADVFIGVNNLTDVAYQNNLSRLKYAPINNASGRVGVFNLGRNFFAKINIPFGN